jgi:hypothetical protein
MKKIFLSVTALLAALIALLAWVFIPNHERLGPQTNIVTLSDEFTVQAYRVLSTDPDANSKFAYFIVAGEHPVDEKAPFLVTSDQFAKVTVTGGQTIHISLRGRVHQFHNDVWADKGNGQLARWFVSLDANYTR